MTMQERYKDISSKSGLSEDVVKRVLKASRESLAESVKKGERATLPGLFTATPEIRKKVEIGGNITSYIKIKSSTSDALESEFRKLSSFNKVENEIQDKKEEEERLTILNFVGTNTNSKGIRTTQISALI